MMGIKIEVCLPASVKQDGAWWISSCPSLDLHSQGTTMREAMVNLEDAVVFFIESCWERGTIFEVLRDAGFELDQADDSKSVCEDDDDNLFVRIPLPFVIAQKQAHDRPRSSRD